MKLGQKIILIVILASFIKICFSAEKPDVENISLEELNKLSPDQVKEYPAIPIIAKYINHSIKKANSKIFNSKESAITIIEIALNDLKFYNFIPQGKMSLDLENAIKLFQKTIHHKPSGILTLDEYSILLDHQDAIVPKDIDVLNKKPVINDHYNSISALGSWYLLGEKIADPINVVRIICTKSEMTCEESVASLAEFKNSNSLLYQQETTFYIRNWQPNEVIAELESGCRKSILKINTSIKEAAMITENISSDECKHDHSLPKLNKPRISRLGGEDYLKKYQVDRRKITSNYYNPEFTRAVLSKIPKEVPFIERFKS